MRVFEPRRADRIEPVISGFSGPFSAYLRSRRRRRSPRSFLSLSFSLSRPPARASRIFMQIFGFCLSRSARRDFFMRVIDFWLGRLIFVIGNLNSGAPGEIN